MGIGAHWALDETWCREYVACTPAMEESPVALLSILSQILFRYCELFLILHVCLRT